MKIVLLASAINVHTIRWANKLVELGNSVSVLTCKNHAPEYSKVTDMNELVRVYPLPFPALGGIGYFLNAFFCRQIIKKLSPDVVNAHYASGYGTLARSARLKPVALSVWGSDVYLFPDRSKLHKALLVSNLKYADLIMSTSEIMARRIESVLETENLNIPITPFGVDLQKFEVRDHNLISPSAVTLGIIKSLKSIYGIDNLIEAIGIIRDTGAQGKINLEVDIYGDGPHRSALEDKVRESNLTDCIHFHGAVPNSTVPEILKKIDIYVLPSLHESFGVAAVEAMAAGIPVVASDAPGLLEVVTDEVNGLRFHVGDSQGLADQIMRLVRDPELRNSMGKSGRLEVEGKFDFDKNAQTFESALKSLVQK